jgi:hypothetical protein
MRCDPVRVTGYVDDAHSAAVMAEVESHLWACARCSAQVVFEVALRRRLLALGGAAARPLLVPVPAARASLAGAVSVN